MKELAEREEQLFNKLSQTHALHKAKYEELERAFNIKVAPTREGEPNNEELLVSKAKTDTLKRSFKAPEQRVY